MIITRKRKIEIGFKRAKRKDKYGGYICYHGKSLLTTNLLLSQDGENEPAT